MAAGASAVVLVERGFRAVRCDGYGFDGNTNLSSIGTAADINAQGGRPESSRTVEKRGKGFEMGISTHVYMVYGVKTEYNGEIGDALWEEETHADLRKYVISDGMSGEYTIIGAVLFDSGDARWEPLEGFEVIDLQSLPARCEEVERGFAELPQFLPLLQGDWKLMAFAHYS